MSAAGAIALFLVAIWLLLALPTKQQPEKISALDEFILEQIEPMIQRLSRAGKAELKKRLD